LRVSSVIIDISIIYTFCLNNLHFIPPNPLIDILRVLFLIMILYFLSLIFSPIKLPANISCSLNCFRLIIKTDFNRYFIREFLYKYLIGFLLPYAVLYLLKWVDFNKNVIAISVFTIIFSLIFWLIKRETWWNLLSKTRVKNYCSQKEYSGFLSHSAIIFDLSYLL